MQRFSTASAGLTALLFLSFGSSAAFAQQSQTDDVITFQKSATPAAAQPKADAGNVALRPIAPPASVVLGFAVEPAGGLAQVIPPAPKVAARGAVMLPRPTGAYSTKLASATSGLRINSNYGYRRDPFTGRGRMHTGVDVHAAWGESVGPSMAGTIAFTGVKHGYGNIIIVDHGGGLSTYYAHLSSIACFVGQPVAAGQLIGYVGSTGRSSGPHLHYEVRANGRPVDPSATIAIDGGRVFVDGRPLGTSPSVEGWGDEPEPTATIVAPAAGAQAGPASRPRRAAKTPAPNKHVLVYSNDTLTDY